MSPLPTGTARPASVTTRTASIRGRLSAPRLLASSFAFALAVLACSLPGLPSVGGDRQALLVKNVPANGCGAGGGLGKEGWRRERDDENTAPDPQYHDRPPKTVILYDSG